MIYINIRGGLGNQLFQYAAAKSFAIDNNEQLCLDLSGITNKTHNVYTLDKFNIEAKIVDNCNVWQKYISKFFSSISYRIGNKCGYNCSYKFDLFFAPLLNFFGIYNIDNGYMKFKKSITKNKYVNGYLQCDKYIAHEERIRKELTLKESLLPKNIDISNKMKTQDSVCIHIRRGDFVDVGGVVCTKEYYIGAAQYLEEKLENAVFYVFSNDVKWVKENIVFPMQVNYVEDNNPNYEELILMASCNNFIISNSTFSWWAQFLSNNESKIVIAPNRWFVDGQREDIYQKHWLIMDGEGKMEHV